MEIKTTEPEPRAGEDQGLNTTGELNLYLDLLAFSELSPEERLVESARLKDAISNQILEPAGEFPGFVESSDTFDGMLSPVEQSEAELPRAEPAEMRDPVFEFLPAVEQTEIIENVEAPLPLVESIEPPAPVVETNDLFRASGPLSLSGPLFNPTLKSATQVMSLAACHACGSEADGEDLFCVSCGAFMDEKPEGEARGLACDDCGLIVETDELICPSCGAVSAVC